MARIRGGSFAGENLVQNYAQRVNVAASRDLLAGLLLGRHVPACSAANVFYFTGHARQAEVGDAQPALPVEHDIARLQIAVHYAFVVRGSQSGAELAGDFQRFVVRQPPDAPQQRGQILAADVFH